MPEEKNAKPVEGAQPGNKQVPKKRKKGAQPGNKNGVGIREGDFKPEYTDALITFFDIQPYNREVIEKSVEYFASGQEKKRAEKFKYMPAKLPTLYRFARSIGVDYSTVWRWAEKGETMQGDERIWHKDTAPEFIRFCNAYKQAKEIQKEFLINIGLSGAAPSPFAIFTAKNVTDMRDKQESEVTHKGSIIYLPPKK